MAGVQQVNHDVVLHEHFMHICMMNVQTIDAIVDDSDGGSSMQPTYQGNTGTGTAGPGQQGQSGGGSAQNGNSYGSAGGINSNNNNNNQQSSKSNDNQQSGVNGEYSARRSVTSNKHSATES